MPAFFRALEKIKPVYDWTYKIILFICKLLLITDIAITAWSVAGRHIHFITDPKWSEEIILTLMVYMAVLSATLAIRRRSHIRMTAFDKYLPRKVLLALDLVADVAVLALGVIMLVVGVKVCNGPLAKFGKYGSIPTLSKFWMYLPIPVAGVGMIIFELEQVFQHIQAFFVKKDDGQEAK